MRIDSAQQLDIVYTTENLLVVTPVGAHTSVVIGRIDDELPCLKYHNYFTHNVGEWLYSICTSSVQRAPYIV